MSNKHKYIVQVGDDYQTAVNPNDLHEFDIVADGDNTFHVLRDQQAYRLEVIEQDYATKSFTIKVNGRTHRLQLGDQYDQLVQQLGLSTQVDQRVRDVKAPMPGLVLEIAVAAGQEVQKGDKLLILEAMKMENVIKSDGQGTIKSVRIEQGAAVDKGQLLIEME